MQQRTRSKRLPLSRSLHRSAAPRRCLQFWHSSPFQRDIRLTSIADLRRRPGHQRRTCNTCRSCKRRLSIGKVSDQRISHALAFSPSHMNGTAWVSQKQVVLLKPQSRIFRPLSARSRCIAPDPTHSTLHYCCQIYGSLLGLPATISTTILSQICIQGRFGNWRWPQE